MVGATGASEAHQGTGAAARLPATARGPRAVLVIDDDPTVRDVTAQFLKRRGFAVTAAAGGVEGLARARELHPTAIILDVVMPGLDGWTVLAALKGDPELADIPVILVTIVDDRQRGYALGAAEYMVKPVDRGQLVAALHRLHDGSGHILLVEDDADTRAMMRLLLGGEGWTVTEAENGRVALERLAIRRPDAIVLDLMMPEMDGFEFLDELRGHAQWCDIPVVVVTAVELSAVDRQRLNGAVGQIIRKSGHDRDALLREVGETLAVCVERRRANSSPPRLAS
jgi:adenylate cyclase